VDGTLPERIGVVPEAVAKVPVRDVGGGVFGDVVNERLPPGKVPLHVPEATNVPEVTNADGGGGAGVGVVMAKMGGYGFGPDRSRLPVDTAMLPVAMLD